jgi:GntR family transcriptional regulator/MocR family aminotransferase
MEDPGYPDARNIFASRTARTVGLKVDEGGLVADGSLRDCDYVYVTPSHQCPATVTMPMERREQLLRIAEDEDVIIFEDDYESENCYSGSPIPALKSIDRNGRVVYIGSLSKSLAPGLRLGYIVASPELVDEIRALRRLMVRHPVTFIQRSFSLFLSLGHHDALTRRLSHIYNKRGTALMDALSRHLPRVTFVPVSGGASCWVRGPDWLDCRELARMAEQRGVLIEPGDVFFMAENPPLNYFRIGFTSIPADRIEKGIRELAAVMNELESRSG